MKKSWKLLAMVTIALLLVLASCRREDAVEPVAEEPATGSSEQTNTEADEPEEEEEPATEDEASTDDEGTMSEDDGEFNAEKFRTTLLRPKLEKAIKAGTALIVSLDGLKSCGSSFLESAFGGLVREEKISKSDLSKHLRVETNQKSLERYKIAIERYIKNA